MQTINARFQELCLFQLDQDGHCQTSTSMMLTFGCAQAWHDPAATNNTNTQLSTTTMAKCQSKRRSQTGFHGKPRTSAESLAITKL
jgi:hypothetical protein